MAASRGRSSTPLLYPVTPQMRVYHEEQFGPVVPIVPYRHLDTVIDYVLESDFGQQLSLFGTNPVAIGRLVDTFANQVGRINLNAQCQRGPDTYPFNGRKNSAEGTLSVHDACGCFRSAHWWPPSSRTATRS
jgi:glyceraldehyde-3-phosphate dehydrogenase (NADP+)